jgi:hypothetical protein
MGTEMQRRRYASEWGRDFSRSLASRAYTSKATMSDAPPASGYLTDMVGLLSCLLTELYGLTGIP